MNESTSSRSVPEVIQGLVVAIGVSKKVKTTLDDPIFAEVRAFRDEHAAKFGYDVEAIFKDIRARQEASGRNYVSFPARRISLETEI